MNYTDELVSVSLLEAIWSSTQQDIIDVITPLILMGVAKTTDLGDCIDLDQVTKYVEKNYGYNDFPTSIVEKVLKRNRSHYFQRKRKYYYLHCSLDQEIQIQVKRTAECKERINKISESLSEFLQMHCRRKKNYSKEEASNALQNFFSRYGIDIEEETIIREEIDPVRDEENYYIAQFIYEKEQNNSEEYNYIIDLVRGYFVKKAIYLQPNNGNIKTAHFNNTVFYYDTPFLLQLLGYQSEEERRAANNLHNILKSQGGEFAYFPQTYDEIVSILTAYQYSLQGIRNSYRTLEGLDDKKYGYSDVDRLKRNFDSTLKSKYGIIMQDVPSYPTDALGNVDQNKVLPEQEFKEFILKKIGHYREDNLDADIRSAVGVYNMRGCIGYDTIEQCKAIFVTTNKDFTRAFNSYYKNNIDRNSIPLVISDTDLSAIAWIKCGKYDSEIPQTQLLANAYAAMRPSQEVMGKFRDIVGQMQTEGKMSLEEAVSLVTSRYVKKELMEGTFGDSSTVNEAHTEQLRDKYKRHLIEDEKKQHEKDINKIRDQQYEKAAEEAHKISAKNKERWETGLTLLACIILMAVFIICLSFLIVDIKSKEFSIKLIGYIIFEVISAVGIFDAILGKFGIIKKNIQRSGNWRETKTYEKEMKKFRHIITNAENDYSE